MVYFFYRKAPKYNRDKYHKRIKKIKKNTTLKEADKTGFGWAKMKGGSNNSFKPPNPPSVIEQDKTIPSDKYKSSVYGGTGKEGFGATYNPPNPASVIEPDNKKTCYVNETGKVFIMDETKCYGWNEVDKETGKTKSNFGTNSFEPPNPASVIEPDKTCYGIDKKKANKTNPKHKHTFNPPNPASVIEPDKDFCYGDGKWEKKKGNTQGTRNFEPPNPASVIEPDKILPNSFKKKNVDYKKREFGYRNL